MMAWVSPSRTVRSTPRRISRWVPAPSAPPTEPALPSTLTCRSRISRVATLELLVSGQRDVDVVAFDLDGVDRHRLGGRQPGGLAGTQVEARPVQPALHRVVVDLAFGQRDLGVRAHVPQGEDLAAGAGHGDGLARDLNPEDAFGRQLGQRAGPGVDG